MLAPSDFRTTLLSSFTVLTSELDFDLPPDLIATQPAPRRDGARLLVVYRDCPDRMQHLHVRDLPDLLQPRDLLVRNATTVIPARLEAVRSDTGGRVEGLFVSATKGATPPTWTCMLKGKSLREGIVINLLARDATPSPYSLLLVSFDRVELTWESQLVGSGTRTTLDILCLVGRPPLPPYILRARKKAGEAPDAPDDESRYQTVFASAVGGPVQGAIAAPTAGLHLTPELIQSLIERSVDFADVVLHVGAGTFKPVETDRLEDHRMHEEWCSMPAPAREQVRSTRSLGGRVICVGTTSARTVESHALAAESLHPENQPPPGSEFSLNWISTRLLISPGYRWRWTDGLLTNFHLPRSTLLAMVASLFPDGVPSLLKIYAQAIDQRYRFFSYGDAMLILPGRS
jgi:S-adenosylmethionine:tRNA ribosyltransferase-isomerase